MKRPLRILKGGGKPRRRRPNDAEIEEVGRLVDEEAKKVAPIVALELAARGIRALAVELLLDGPTVSLARRKMANEARKLADSLDRIRLTVGGK